MPRRRERFKQLERELKATGYAPDPGTCAAAYLDFKKGVNKINMENPPSSAERVRKGVALLPFGIKPPDAPTALNRYVAPITALSNTGRTNLQLSNNDLGYEALAAGNKKPDNYYPPVLRVFNKTAADPTTPVSGILKKEYTRYVGRSYFIPFGRSTTLGGAGFGVAVIGEEDSRDILVQRITGANVRASVSYDPEIFTSRRADLESLIGDAP